jgi:hypothetical protein
MRILQGYPRKALSRADIKVRSIQCVEQELGWISQLTREMSKAGIAQGTKLGGKSIFRVPLDSAARQGGSVRAKSSTARRATSGLTFRLPVST